MRTNIVIDDKLMADVMAYGDFKTKREAVEEGLRMLKRRKVYDGLLALQGQLQWDDSDEGWARWRAQQQAFCLATGCVVAKSAQHFEHHQIGCANRQVSTFQPAHQLQALRCWCLIEEINPDAGVHQNHGFFRFFALSVGGSGS